jgi:hypothetical protein
VKNLTLFQYLAAFVTIVLAIALSDMLMSAHRLIIARKRVRWSAIPLLAASFVLLNVLSEFFSVWVAANVQSVSFAYLVLLVFVSGVTAMAAFAVLPDEVPPEGLDLWASYIDRRVYLYCVLTLGLMGDIGRSTLHFTDAHGVVPLTLPILRFYFVDTGAIALLAILAWSKDWRVHAVILSILYSGFVYYGFLGWTIK